MPLIAAYTFWFFAFLVCALTTPNAIPVQLVALLAVAGPVAFAFGVLFTRSRAAADAAEAQRARDAYRSTPSPDDDAAGEARAKAKEASARAWARAADALAIVENLAKVQGLSASAKAASDASRAFFDVHAIVEGIPHPADPLASARVKP